MITKLLKGSLVGLSFAFGMAAQAAANQAPVLESQPSSLDDQGRILIPVGVGEQGSYPFLLDTAASRTVVYRKLVSELGLEALPRRSTRVMTATGAREMQLYRLGDLHVLGLTMTVHETVAMPDVGRRDIYGIVGVDLMRGRVLLLGKGRAQLVADEFDLPGREEDWLRVDGRPVGYGSVAVTVTIGGHEIPAIVDTGAGASVLNRAALDLLQQDDTDGVSIDRATLSSSGGTVAAQIVMVREMNIGGWKRSNERLTSAQLPIFAVYGAARTPAMILGADILLSPTATAIDFNDWALWINHPTGHE